MGCFIHQSRPVSLEYGYSVLYFSYQCQTSFDEANISQIYENVCLQVLPSVLLQMITSARKAQTTAMMIMPSVPTPRDRSIVHVLKATPEVVHKANVKVSLSAGVCLFYLPPASLCACSFSQADVYVYIRL